MAEDEALFQSNGQQNIMERSTNWWKAKSNIVSLLYELSQLSYLAETGKKKTVFFIEIKVEYEVICGLD